MRSNFCLLVLQFLFVFPLIFDFAQSQSSIGDIPLSFGDYHRIRTDTGSFAEWLRELPLKSPGSAIVDYRDGIFKSGNDTAVAFVVDLDIKGRRLEQCVDILVRFYADYCWGEKQIENLILPLPGGYWLKWQDWVKGFRPVFKGIDVIIRKSTDPDTSFLAYKTYLNTVFNESHTQQYYHAFKPVERTEVQIGDIIIRKGTKGHAIMIVDLAINDFGDKIALIGNGDTPACQFFLLNYKTDNPWIPLNFDRETLKLPLRREMSWDGLRRLNLPKE